jgi:putative transposase
MRCAFPPYRDSPRRGNKGAPQPFQRLRTRRILAAMPDYRRNRVAGGTYFFTVNLLDRRADLLIARIDALRAAVRAVRARSPFHIDAGVVLPDHMHCLWTLPDGDADFPARWRAIKVAFAKSLPPIEPRSPVRLRRGERGIWQRRYWEHTIRDDRDYALHMDYIHFNPVKHGLACGPADWPFSSFRRCVARGLYPPDWLGGAAEPAETGERR